jgi:hypothetical protein
MNQIASVFTMKKENVEPAFKALKEHFTEVGDKSWISGANVLRAKTFKEAMKECRWDIGTTLKYPVSGQVIQISFNGEKLGDDESVLNVIAPYVEAGSYIEMSGEDDNHWRWEFDGSSCTQKYGEVTYGDHREIVEALLKHDRKFLLTLVGIHPGLDARIHEALSQRRPK